MIKKALISLGCYLPITWWTARARPPPCRRSQRAVCQDVSAKPSAPRDKAHGTAQTLTYSVPKGMHWWPPCPSSQALSSDKTKQSAATDHHFPIFSPNFAQLSKLSLGIKEFSSDTHDQPNQQSPVFRPPGSHCDTMAPFGSN